MGKGILTEICEDNNIRWFSFQKADELIKILGLAGLKPCGGFTHDLFEETHIYYDETRPKWEREYIMAHEIGHVLMGHLGRPEGSEVEIEANTFACVMLALELFSFYGNSRLSDF